MIFLGIIFVVSLVISIYFFIRFLEDMLIDLCEKRWTKILFKFLGTLIFAFLIVFLIEFGMEGNLSKTMKIAIYPKIFLGLLVLFWFYARILTVFPDEYKASELKRAPWLIGFFVGGLLLPFLYYLGRYIFVMIKLKLWGLGSDEIYHAMRLFRVPNWTEINLQVLFIFMIIMVPYSRFIFKQIRASI